MQTLVESGVNVVVYDPLALPAVEKALGSDVAYAESSADAVRRADVIVVTTAWSEFGELQPEVFGRDGEPRTLIDLSLLSGERFKGVARYRALGEGTRSPAAVARKLIRLGRKSNPTSGRDWTGGWPSGALGSRARRR